MALTQSSSQQTQLEYCFPIERLARAFAGLAAWMRRRRRRHESAILLNAFNDRMLADIGLRRDRRGRPCITRF